jgi:hypothetical protein
MFEKIGRATRNLTYSNFLSFLNGNTLYVLFFYPYLNTVSKESFFPFQLNERADYEGRKLHTPRKKKPYLSDCFLPNEGHFARHRTRRNKLCDTLHRDLILVDLTLAALVTSAYTSLQT